MTDKKKMLLGVIFSFVLIFMGGTYAYWSWQSSVAQKTNVTFTATADFLCTAYGDGSLELTSSNVVMAPSSCTNSNHVIKRKLEVDADIFGADLSVYMDLWLDVKKLDVELSESQNFRYALTTSETSCDEGVVASGTFSGRNVGDKINILGREFTASGDGTYYLYIWLDSAETDISTAGKQFQFQLNGKCSNDLQPETPVIDGTGLIPVFLYGDGNALTRSQGSNSWYNYSEQEWANAVLVTSASRSKYHGKEGVNVSKDDVLAYYVWIPRFKYKIWTTGVSSTGSEQTIDIVFEGKEAEFSTGTTVGSYRTHPAFWWDNNSNGIMDSGEKLAGIWVGKFVTTGTAAEPTIKYTANPLTGLSKSGVFTSSLRFSGGILASDGNTYHEYNDTYGLDGSVDSHAMKNSEWGAVAYLSQSIYGVNSKLSGGYGCGKALTGNCAFEYSKGNKISTTNNVTGVFDVANDIAEDMMAGVNSNISFGIPAERIVLSKKYYDNYIMNEPNINACTIEMCGGHALSETYGWYSESGGSSFPSSGSYFRRKGDYSYSQFYFSNSTINNAWRSVLVNLPSYRISYTANGGIGAPDTDVKIYGERAFISSTIPTRTGYEFLGWNTEKDGSGDLYSAGDQYTENTGVTLYAQWSGSPVVNISSATNDVADKQSVIFNVSDEVGVVEYYVGTINPNNSEVIWNSIESTTSKDITATVDKSGTWYFAAKDKDGNIGVKSQIVYKTNLVLSNATVPSKNVITLEGNSITLPIPTVNSKYTFNGWYTASDYSGNAITTYKPTGNNSLYAKIDGNTVSISNGVQINGKNMVGETLTVTHSGLNEVDTPDSEITTLYQWYYNSSNSATGGVKINGATSSSYTISKALVNKYIYVVVTLQAENLLDQVVTDITDATLNGTATVDSVPVVSIGAKNNNLLSTTQTAILECIDNAGVVGYYFGTNNEPTGYSNFSGTTMRVETNISSAGTYYLFCKDGNNNVTSSSTTYYNYRVHTMFEKARPLNGYDRYNTSNYDEIKSSNYIFPADVEIDTSKLYAVPAGSASERLLGFSYNIQPSSVDKEDEMVVLTGEKDFYYWFSRNRLYVSYGMSGGTFGETTSNSIWSNINGKIYKDGAIYYTTISYGNPVNLTNYTSSNGLNIVKTGYSAVSGSEWRCLEGCEVGNLYSHTINYESDDFCDISNSDCVVHLEVNWQPNEYTVSYNANGGTGTMENMVCTYDDECTLTTNAFTRVGYTFKGWATTSDATSITYENEKHFSKFDIASDTTLYAVWEPNEYTISYNKNGGTGTMENMVCTYDDECTLATNSFTRVGYTFKGWATTSNATSITYENEKHFSKFDIASDTTLYAVWERNPIRIYYNVNGGTVGGDYSVDEDGFVKLGDNLFYHELMDDGTPFHLSSFDTNVDIAKEGHSLSGDNPWNTAPDGSGTVFDYYFAYLYDAFINDAIDEGSYYRLDLYVIWTPNTYTITYNANGGVGTMEPTTCTYGQQCTLASNNFTRFGYEFLHWLGESDGSINSYLMPFTYDITEDLTLYVNWKASRYDIIYELNGGIYYWYTPVTGADYDEIFVVEHPIKEFTLLGLENGTNATYVNSDPTPLVFKGWTFDGNTSTALYGNTIDSVTTPWNNNNTLVNSIYFKNLDFPGPVTLTAHWGPASLNVPTITKTGYSCKWNTAPDGSGTDYASGAIYTSVDRDDGPTEVELYAQCTPNTYSVNYDANGGSGAPARQTKTYGETLSLSEVVPTRENYTFVGWYPDDSTATSAIYAASGAYTENKSVTLYAVWQPNVVNIYYNVNGGDITTPTTSQDGSETYNWTTDTDGTLSLNGTLKVDRVTYGETLTSNGLANYNNPYYMDIMRDNSLVGKTGAEWICLSGCTVSGQTYNQDMTTYTVDDFCDVSEGDCTVELGVNWVDEIAPTCELYYDQVDSMVLFQYKDDNVGVTDYGLVGRNSEEDKTPVYNGNTSIGEAGYSYIFGFVKDAAGNSSYCLYKNDMEAPLEPGIVESPGPEELD